MAAGSLPERIPPNLIVERHSCQVRPRSGVSWHRRPARPAKPNLISSSGLGGIIGRRCAQQLEPASDMRRVVTIGVAEAQIEICFFARNNGVAKCDRQRHCEQEYPGAAYGYADPDQEEKHCEIDGIAAPAVNSGRHQCSRGPSSLNGRSGAGEVANACGKDRDSDEYCESY